MAEEHIVPVVGHRFRVEIQGATKADVAEYFYSIDGLEVRYHVQAHFVGGHAQPSYVPYHSQAGRLVLVRPLVTPATPLTVWCEHALKLGIFSSAEVGHIFLMGNGDTIDASWTLGGVYPMGVQISPLGRGQARPGVDETITLVYNHLERNLS